MVQFAVPSIIALVVNSLYNMVHQIFIGNCCWLFIFIFEFKWGVAGAGWATITGQILNAIYFIFCIRKCKTVKLEKKVK